MPGKTFASDGSGDGEEARRQIRATIQRGRVVPRALDVLKHSSWVDPESGTRWERLSIRSESEPSLNERLPMIIVRPPAVAAAEDNTARRQAGSSSSSSSSSSSQGGGLLPVVVVMHGTTRAKSDPAVRAAMERYAARFGWAALTFDSRYHGERSGRMTGSVGQAGRQAGRQ